MTAARLSGTSFPRMLLGHIAPIDLPQLLTYALLGYGDHQRLQGTQLRRPRRSAAGPELEHDRAGDTGTLSAQPRYVFLPSAALFITVVSFNLLGEGLRARWSTQ